ncbi:hypothetical protein SD71_01185 [Cohnella kolymensis]|uniref:Uncharacterized protein n=1 Tax=Cohnella kolymensis TaxID=1590652 RepID=A0ABR5A8F6_9BACL|nr:hypothetical protein [Cohnella kolymensis]KIL37331.1 hypothetical protein SD71_01185 [Cohnella kolymensis]
MTINEIFEEEFSGGRDFSFAWRIFLDRFYASTKEQRSDLIRTAPECLDDPRHLSYCAAGIHKLCREYSLDLPEWVSDKSLILDEPYFPGASTDLLKLVCLVESPPEFKMRNIFTTDNVLTRT